MPHPPLGDLHISAAEMGIPLAHRQLSVSELGGRVDEIGCFHHPWGGSLEVPGVDEIG